MDESRVLSGKPLLVIVLALLLSLALIALDQTVVATALPVIVSDFNALQDTTWIVGGYLLSIVAFTPMYGQALTILPTKWVYMAAVALFELGSLFCGVAPSVDFLIFGRVTAGVGAAGICVSVLTIVAESAEMRYRVMIFGAIGAVFSVSNVVGPILGGVLTTRISWRWCFYINLPLGALFCLLIAFGLPLHKPYAGTSPAKTTIQAVADMDWIGCLLCLASMVFLVLPLSWGSNRGWNSPLVISLLCVFVLLLTCLVLWERHKGSRGILPLEVIARRSQAGVCIVVFFTMFNNLVLVYYIPLFYQAVYDHSAIRSGIDMLPFLLSMVVTATCSAFVLSQTGHYWSILVFGPAFCCIAGGLLFTVSVHTSSVRFIVYQVLYGIGVGASQNTFVVLQAHAEPETVPICNAIATFMQILGGFIGVTIAGVVFDSQLHRNLAVYAPGVDPGPITESVTAIYTTVSSTARPGVLDAYVKSLGCVFLTAVPAGFLTMLSAALIRNVNLNAVGSTPTSDQLGERGASSTQHDDGEKEK